MIEDENIHVRVKKGELVIDFPDDSRDSFVKSLHDSLTNLGYTPEFEYSDVTLERKGNTGMYEAQSQENYKQLVVDSLKPEWKYGHYYFVLEEEHAQPDLDESTEVLYSVDMFVDAFRELLDQAVEPTFHNLNKYKNYSKKCGYGLENQLEKWFVPNTLSSN